MRLPILSLAMVAPLLVACESTSRLGGSEPRVAARPGSPVIETAPAMRVESAPLAPPPGTSQVSSPGGMTAGTPAEVNQQHIAKASAPRVEEEDNSVPTRTSVTGNWIAKEAAGSCRLTLSSSPKLDLYAASTSGCKGKDLQRVTAWELHGDEVYLYEPGGGVAARLKARNRSMDGTLANTGAPVSLSK